MQQCSVKFWVLTKNRVKINKSSNPIFTFYCFLGVLITLFDFGLLLLYKSLSNENMINSNLKIKFYI